MIQSNALSRRPDFCPDEDKDNEDIIMLPNDMFLNLIDTDLQQRISLSTDLDSAATETAPTLMTTGLKDWTIDKTNNRNILFYKGKNYIPRDIALRRDIVHSFHDHKTAGHPGEIGTYNAIHQHYWWKECTPT